jgi:rubrerythrin
MSDLEKINGEEAIQMAIALEEQGQRFYQWAAGQIEDDEPARMLRGFSEDEREHEMIFRNMAEKTEPIQPLFDEEEAEAYLGALVEDKVFPDQCQWEKRVDTFTGPVSIVNYAIQAEKDSIRLYTEMMIQAKTMGAKKTLRRVMEEEKGHRDKLERYLSTLS